MSNRQLDWHIVLFPKRHHHPAIEESGEFQIRVDVQFDRRVANAEVTNCSIDTGAGATRWINGQHIKRILPAAIDSYPALGYGFGGEQREQSRAIGGMIRGFLLALFVMYTLLAIPFRSYLQPLIVMSAIPFGLIGAVWGHVVMAMDLTIMSMFGIITYPSSFAWGWSGA